MVGKLYRELVSMLSWLVLGSCPSIVFVTGMLTCFDHNLGCAHQEAVKCVLHYLKGMRGWHLTLGGDQLEVSACTEADWGNDCDDRHSIGAYIIKVGGGAVSWKSKKHVCVTLSSTEAEYVALCQAVKESVWTIEFLKTLGVLIHDAMMVNVDNQGAMALARNPVFHNWYPCSVLRHHQPSEVCISSLCIKHAVSYMIILCNTYIYCHII